MRTFLKIILITSSLLLSSAKAQTIEEATHLLDVWLEAQKDYNDWPGLSVSIVSDKKILYARSFGYANSNTRQEATPDTLYRIASNSKLFTAIAIMQLRDAGKLSLNDPIEKHIEWYNIKQRHPLSDDVTIEGLLTHSSGLPREPDMPYWSFRDGYPFPNVEELAKATSTQETLYRAWDQYQYSNLGYTLLGQVVENASGMPYEDYIHKNILVPMGLSNTVVSVDAASHGHELAIGYGHLNRKRERMEVPFVDAKATASAAGISSSANDLAKFLIWQLKTLEGQNNEVLDQNSLREMMRPQAVNTGPEFDVGYGFRTAYRNSKNYVGHGGVFVGHTSQTTIVPDQKIGGVALMNTHDMSPSNIVNNMIDLMTPILNNPTSQHEADFSDYQGIYDQQPWGDEDYIMKWGEHLISFALSSKNPLAAMSKFRHIGGDKFIRIRSDGGEADVMTFRRDQNGKVIGYKDQSDYIAKKN